MKRILSLVVSFSVVSSLASSTPGDDVHNHDGSHPEGPANCGTNYMLPGETARLGSHSFMILGINDESHIIAEHRSGTPPHNYQYLFRVRLDTAEMQDVRDLFKTAKTLPAFTTIYFDSGGKQIDRTFFCNQDLAKIFGPEQKAGDAHEKLFPIRASLQANPDHEGGFEIEKSVVRGKVLTLERADFELTVSRYLPSYLAQDLLRKVIKEKPQIVLPLFKDAPLTFNESRATAAKRKSYMATDGSRATVGRFCSKNYYLKNTPMAETIHTFLLMGEVEPNTVLAVHYYDHAPQNFQTTLKLRLDDNSISLYRRSKEYSNSPPLLQTRKSDGTNHTFCMDDIRKLVMDATFSLKGTLYKNSELAEYKLGVAMGAINVPAKNITVLVNRRLESFMNPLDVAADVKNGGMARPAAKSTSAY